jgi:solute carrier family 13 (sodium-dependent dicarboxylate transporter), member 2/3/5
LVEYPRISASCGRRTIGLFLTPLLTVAFLVLHMDIPREQQELAAVLLGVIALWITEAVPIPIGGLLGVAVAVFLGVAPVDDVLGPFGTSTIFMFIDVFILAQPMLKHGVARRFAFRILALPRAGRSTTGVILAFGAITCLLSAFVSNTAMVAMLLLTAIGILSIIAKLLHQRGDVV